MLSLSQVTLAIKTLPFSPNSGILLKLHLYRRRRQVLLASLIVKHVLLNCGLSKYELLKYVIKTCSSVEGFYVISSRATPPLTKQKKWLKPYKRLTLPWGRSLSYRNQSIDLLCKSVDWFLYDRGLCHERVN